MKIITDYRIGIHARNIPFLSVGSDLFTAFYDTPNTINFDQTSFNANHRGIWLENCPDAQVQENIISKSNPSTPSGTFTVEGIFHTLGARGLINWNVINQLPVPIHIRDDCSDTELHCNDINNDTDPGLGVLLTSAVLPDQGTSTNPWNNRWFGYDNTTLFGVNTDAPGPPFDWFYNTGNAAFNPNPAIGTAVAISTSATGITCAVEVAPDDPDRDVRYAAIAEDSLLFADHEDEFIYKSKQYLFEQIYADTSLLTKYTSKDSTFSSFYSDITNTNIGIFNRVDSLIVAGNLAAALTLNSSISDTNQIEANLKTVNSILISKVLVDSSLSSTDSTALESIATADPLIAGKAVYMAKAILFKEVHFNLPALRIISEAFIHEVPEPKIASFQIIPNPANEKCEILFEALNNDFVLELRNGVGQVLYHEKLPSHSLKFELPLLGYKPGFYMISINDGMNGFQSRKLIIVR